MASNTLKSFFKSTFLYRVYQRSAGNIFYPFHSLGWRLAGLLTPRRSVKVNGVCFNLSCNNWITHFRWFLFKTKEKEVREFIDRHVKEGDTFFDIGANVGVFSVYTAMKNDGVKVFSFEPEYSNLFLLKENIIHNRLQDRIHPLSVAVSDQSGVSALRIQDYTPGAAVHTESRADIDTTDEGYNVIWSEGVCTLTLDDICSQLGVVPNVMKLDTDGNEDKIFSGGTKTLADNRLRSLIIELPMQDEKVRSCKDYLDKAGFKLDWSDPDKTRNQVWVKG